MMPRGKSHRSPLLWLALSLMAGIALGRISRSDQPVLWLTGAATAAGAAVWLSRRSVTGWAVSLTLAMLLTGSACYRLHNPPTDWGDLPPREVRVLVHLVRVFPRTDLSSVGIGRIVGADGPARGSLGQRVYFSIRRTASDPVLVRSTTAWLTGVLVSVPAETKSGSFDRYLAEAGVHFRLARGRLDEVAGEPARYYVFLEHAAGRLNAWMSEAIAAKRPALAAVFRAMMLGQKHELSTEQDEVFMHSGTMHLFAINGLHIGVVAVSLRALLALLRCPRTVAALITLAVLWFDVDTTGASPSAVRAFVLVACYQAGFVLRRPANGIATLAGAALLVLLADPNALFTASFQMSYGVVLTILCFGLPLSEWLEHRFTPYQTLPAVSWSLRQKLTVGLCRHLAPALGIGVAATLVGLITGPAFFGVIAPVGFVSNLILVPLAMLVIVAGFASIVAGCLGLLPIVVLFNHAALLILVCIDALIRGSVTLPAAWWSATWRQDWCAPVALAVLLATVLVGYAVKWSNRWGGWWPPFIVTALALAGGVTFG
jgi:competence protein ComEC